MQDYTEDRLRLLRNGYTPLPNVDKLCQLTGWPRVEVTEDLITRVWSRMGSFTSTGLRLQDGLAVIDFDVDHAEVAGLYDSLLEQFPELGRCIMRVGRGHKEAWFLRTSEAFGRIATPTYRDPDAGEDSDGLTVEIYGGASPRQFGAIGWHTQGVRRYSWLEDESPLTVPLSALPEISIARFEEIARACYLWLDARFERVRGESVERTSASTAWDLTPEMVFWSHQRGGPLSLDELRGMVGGGYVYVSASFIDGPVARNRRRCSVSLDHAGGLCIWDSMTDITHHEARLRERQPEDVLRSVESVADRLRALGAILPEETAPVAAQAVWRPYLLTAEGNVRQNEANVAIWIQNNWPDVLSLSTFDWQIWLMQPPPGLEDAGPYPRTLRDRDISHLVMEMQQDVLSSVSPSKVNSGVAIAAGAAPHNGPADYLRSLVWDGVARMHGLSETYFGARPERSLPYVRAACRKWLISAVARVLEPGCKADHMLVLQGPQGAGKSSALAILGGQWFGDDMPPVGAKDAKDWLRYVWIAEIAELSALRGKDVEHVKAFLTTRVDAFRKAYGAVVESVPRHTAFVGSTNAVEFLTDPTGGRRFWPVPFAALDRAALERDRDQIWAEAVAAYRAGEIWHFDEVREAYLLDFVREEQELAYETNPDEARILDWCRHNVEEHTSVRDVYAHVFLPPDRRMDPTPMRMAHVITEALRRGGWTTGTTVRGTKRWVRTPAAAPYEPLTGGGSPAERAAKLGLEVVSSRTPEKGKSE